MMMGAPLSAPTARSFPASAGESEEASARTVLVIPFAAERSSGRDDRHHVRLARGHIHLREEVPREQQPIASEAVGMKGTAISSTFEGRCVKTIVLISPMRFASGTAISAERPESRFVAKKTWPSSSSERPNRSTNQYARILCTTKPPAKASIEKSALSFDTTGREVCSPLQCFARPGFSFGSRRLDGIAEEGAHDHQPHADGRIDAEQHGEALRSRCGASALEEAHDPAARERPQRRGAEAGDIVPGEIRHAPLRGDELRQRRLFHRQEWTGLASLGADHPDRRRQREQPEAAAEFEQHARQQDQKAAHDERAPPSPAIRVRREEERDHRVAKQRQREEQADLPESKPRAASMSASTTEVRPKPKSRRMRERKMSVRSFCMRDGANSK